MVMSIWIVEPPEFFYVQKKYEECLRSLNYIAKFNGLPPLKEIKVPEKEEQN